MVQLDLLSYRDQPQPQPTITPSYKVTHDPLKGFRVVMASGLTTASPVSPCRSCDSFGRDMESCSENCPLRTAYLEQIGMPLVSSVAADGSYVVGSN